MSNASFPNRIAHLFRRLFILGLFGVLGLAVLAMLDRVLPPSTLNIAVGIVLATILFSILGHFIVRFVSADEHFIERRSSSLLPTDQQLDELEQQLGVLLPDDYRRLMREYPVQFDRGNIETPLWNDVAALIRRNRELRVPLSRRADPWPKHLLLIGTEPGPGAYALDLSQSPSPVLWSPSGKHADLTVETATLKEFVSHYLDDLRAQGLDPQQDYLPPPPWNRAMPGCLALPLGILLLLAVLVVLWAGWNAL